MKMDEALIRFRGELYRSAEARIQARRRRVRTLSALAVAGALMISGAAIAAVHLRDSLGSPAPANVVRDFGTYHPELGFHPAGSDAVLVAEDEVAGVGLYSAPNAEGTACVTFTAPWKKGLDQDDGGTCIARAAAGEAFLAGWMGGGHRTPGGQLVAVIAGRVTTAGAVSVRFADAAGKDIVRPLGIGGYFVAVVGPKSSNLFADFCPARDWAPTFTALDASGHELSGAAIAIESVIKGACGYLGSLHGPR
jgi:hypothetical protein